MVLAVPLTDVVAFNTGLMCQTLKKVWRAVDIASKNQRETYSTTRRSAKIVKVLLHEDLDCIGLTQREVATRFDDL